MDEHNPYASPMAEPKSGGPSPLHLGIAGQPPARPVFRVLAMLIAAMGLTTLFLVPRVDVFGLLFTSWFTLEMAWIGLTGYGLYLGRRFRTRVALEKPQRVD